jgi:acetyl-CoA acetyltransferase
MMSMFFVHDNYAVQRFKRGISAQENDYFGWEITPVEVEVSGGRGGP